MSFFCLISIRLSRFHDSNHGFDGLNQLTWVIFFIYPSLKLVKQYGKHYNKLNKSQQDKILLIKNLWVRWKCLEKNIIELWVNECINLHVNNIECRYKPYIKMHKFLTENGEKLKGKFYYDYGENPDTKINIFNHTITFSLHSFFVYFLSPLSNKEAKNKHNEFSNQK